MLSLIVALAATALPPVAGPQWAQRPSAKDVLRYYPPRALNLGMSGHATIRCAVTAQGALTACSIIEETPPGWKFGEAVLRLAPAFRLQPQDGAGRSIEGATITIPLTFATR